MRSFLRLAVCVRGRGRGEAGWPDEACVLEGESSEVLWMLV